MVCLLLNTCSHKSQSAGNVAIKIDDRQVYVAHSGKKRNCYRGISKYLPVLKMFKPIDGENHFLSSISINYVNSHFSTNLFHSWSKQD